MNAQVNWVGYKTIVRKEVMRILRIWAQTVVPPAITTRRRGRLGHPPHRKAVPSVTGSWSSMAWSPSEAGRLSDL